MEYRTALTIALLLIAAVDSGAEVRTYDWRSYGAASDTLRAIGPDGKARLSFPFILPGTDTVLVDGKLLSRESYVLNRKRGIIRFLREVPGNSRVVVRYVHMPFLTRSVFSLRPLSFSEASPPPDAGIRPPSTPPAAKEDSYGRLRLGGMKSISFSFGSNRGLTLDQTLRATITGEITPTIRVEALLSDENLPIQPEGNTEELEYLDKVYMEITGPGGKAALGDIVLANTLSTFSPFQRNVRGVSAELKVKGSRFIFGGASSKGIFKTVSFRGTEGLQGPYELLTQGRLSPEVIIAGSEKVYLDGELLSRGQNRDYVMDYDRGTITFTPRRLITADSEIAVDFEVTQESYDRTAVLAGVANSGLPGGLELSFLFAGERDDPARPKNLELTDEDREILDAAGDDPGAAVTEGVTVTAPGEGEYRLVPADTASGVPAHYAYDDSSGSYILTFTEVGTGKGDYVLAGISSAGKPIYRFAGTGLGNYAIGRKIPLPASHDLYVLRLQRKGAGFHLDLEYDLSDYDANLLSRRDDGDNLGDAASIEVGVDDVGMGGFSLGLRAGLSTLSERFKSFEKERTWYFYRDWNLEKVPVREREVLGEVAATLSREEGVKLEYEFGKIERGDYEGDKHEGRFGFRRGGERDFNGRVFLSRTEGDYESRRRSHQTYDLRLGVWKFLPSLRFSDEEFLKSSPTLPDSGIAYRLYRISVANRKGGTFSYELSFEDRNTEELYDTTSGWIPSRKDRTFSFRASSRGGGPVRGELGFTHRVEENFMFDDTRTSDLARVKATVSSRRAGLRFDIDYEISQNRKRTLEKNVVFVGEGKGDYNSLGDPVGKGRGAYMLVFLPTASLLPTRSVDLTLRTTLWKGRKPGGERGGLTGWLVRNLSLEQTLGIKEESTFDEAYKVYLLFPSALQRDDHTLFGVTNLRQDWSFLDGYRNTSLYYRLVRVDEEDNQFGETKEDRLSVEHSLKLDRSISKTYSLTAELKSERRKRGGRNLPAFAGAAYDVTGWSAAAGGGVRFSAAGNLDGLVEYARRKDDVTGAAETLISLKPRFILRPFGIVTLFGNYEFTRAIEEEGAGGKPILFLSGGDSHRWNFTVNARAAKMISVVATYSGRSEKGFSGSRIVDHNFKVETRAFF